MSENVDAPIVAGDRRNPRPSKGERQRRAILDSLVRLLATRPIGELTVAEVAAQAGVSRPGFYVYFETKFSALAVVTSEAWNELMDRTQTYARRDGETPEQYLDRTGAVGLDVWHEHDRVLIASIQAIPLDPQIAALWVSWNTLLSRKLTEEVVRDRNNGQARPPTADIEELVATIHAMTQHMFYLDRLNRNDREATRRMFASVKTIWLTSAWGLTHA